MLLKPCNAKSSTKGRKPKNTKLTSLGCDETVTMMHALGRVLNPKCKSNKTICEASSTKQICCCPDLETNTAKLLHSPEQLADDFMSQPAIFMNLLHANYMCHFKDIDDIVQSTDMLSSTDVVLNEWRVTYTILEMLSNHLLLYNSQGRCVYTNRFEHRDPWCYGVQPKSSHRLATDSGTDKIEKVCLRFEYFNLIVC